MKLNEVAYPVKPRHSENLGGLGSDASNPFEIMVLNCRSKKVNESNDLSSAKVYYFKPKSRKILKSITYNPDAISKANNLETQRDTSGCYGNVFYDSEDQACILFDSKISPSKIWFTKPSYKDGILTPLITNLSEIKKCFKVGKNQYMFLGIKPIEEGIKSKDLQAYEVYSIGTSVELSGLANIIPDADYI